MGALLGAIGGGIQVGKDLIGTASNQTQGSQSGYNLGLPGFAQRDIAQGFAGRAGQQIGTNAGQLDALQGRLGGYEQRAASSAPQLGQVSLNTEFQGPQFGQGLDARGQALMSQELQNRQAQQARQQQNIAQQFGGRNPGLAGVLSAQSQAQSQLANNPLAFQAAEARNSQMINEANAMQQAQQLTNQARVGQQGFNNQSQLQQQQGLLSALQNAGNFGQAQSQAGSQALAQQLQGLGVYGRQDQNTQQSGRSGGLFQK